MYYKASYNVMWYSDIIYDYAVPVKKNWFYKRHHVSTGIISRTNYSHMDGLQREEWVIIIIIIIREKKQMH